MPEPEPAHDLPALIEFQIDAELASDGFSARIVRLDLGREIASVLCSEGSYLIDMCLTPRPAIARGGYSAHWGPHRFEKLGDIYIVPPGESLHVHGGLTQQAALMCELSSALVEQALGRKVQWPARHLPATLDIGSARLRSLLQRIADEVRHPGPAASQLAGFMAGELAIEIGRHGLAQHQRPQTGGLAGWRLRLIDERLDEGGGAPTLAELSSLCGLSPRQLTRAFRVSRGCSVGDYLERHRMEQAKRLLMQGNAVKSVAFALGFQAPASFTFAFRRAVGMSPSQFRQQQARGIELRP